MFQKEAANVIYGTVNADELEGQIQENGKAGECGNICGNLLKESGEGSAVK